MAAAYGNAIPAWGDSGSVLLNLVATTRRVQHGGGENGDSISAESSYVAPRPSRYGMSYFEFLMVLIGLVGAIAVSEILVFWGHAIRNWGSVRGPGLLGAACSLMLFNVIGHVTGIWGLPRCRVRLLPDFRRSAPRRCPRARHHDPGPGKRSRENH